MARLALVTGANQGIGKAIAAGLAKHGGYKVIMAARKPHEAEAAAKEIGGDNVVVAPCGVDITRSIDVGNLAQYVESHHNNKLDVLINNAGFAYKGDTFGEQEARITIGVNFLGTANVTEALLPALSNAARSHGEARIINVCSQAGRLGQVSPDLQARFQDPEATKASIAALCEEFTSAIGEGQAKGSFDGLRAKGWPQSMYGVSKLAEIAYTYTLARDLRSENIIVNAVCPGYCSTNMSSYKGPRSADKGAETPVWLATRDVEHDRPGKVGELTGGFYYDKQLISW